MEHAQECTGEESSELEHIDHAETAEIPQGFAQGKTGEEKKAALVGQEHPISSNGKSRNPPDAERRTERNGAESPSDDKNLAAVIEAWPKLPATIQAGIAAMARAASGQSHDDEVPKGVRHG